MKTITINFESWCGGGNGSRPISRTYNRIYLFGHIWTPFVVVSWGFWRRLKK